MAPEVVAKAFDPFFTTKPIGQGTGLGLSMIYGFAKQSGGHARILSQPGIGTNVCLYLPRHSGALPVAEETPGPSPLAAGQRREVVLVVDDEPTVRSLVAETLTDAGFEVLEAGDGAGGLGFVRSAARIDLLVSDVGLPGGMNGRQLADAARDVRPGLKVLFITGYADASAVLAGPGMHVMTKPFPMESLAARVIELVAHGVDGAYASAT